MTASDIAISVEGLSKLYRLGAAPAHGTLQDSLSAWFGSLLGRRNTPSALPWAVAGANPAKPSTNSEGSPNDLWALRDISFEVRRGDCVGIIGRNGAGKSTLLKVLSRITEPTHGRVRLRGRVASLLEVGTGFHAELTGRENIFLNGAILGMRRAEIRARFDEIVAFAELERFIDTPVKRYSSGMYMRLAFAVAAHLEPEILIIDEVLAVGDATFQKKCLGKMGDANRSGRTVLFVSHNMGAVTSLCNRAVLLAGGQLQRIGQVADCIAGYVSPDSAPSLERHYADEGGRIALLASAVRFTPDGDTPTTSAEIHLEMTVRIDKLSRDQVICGFTLFDQSQVAFLSSYYNDLGQAGEDIVDGLHRLECRLPPHWLNEGRYRMEFDVGVAKVRRATDPQIHACEFTLHNVDGIGHHFGLGRSWRTTPMLPLLDWKAHAKAPL